MASDVSQTDLAEAQHAAESCWEVGVLNRLWLSMAWSDAKRKADGQPAGQTDPIAVFDGKARQALVVLAERCHRGREALTPQVQDHIVRSNAKAGNLPGFTMGPDRYTTAHQAAVYAARGYLAAALAGIDVALDPTSALDLRADRGEADRLDPAWIKKMLPRLRGDARALWNSVTEWIQENAPHPEVTLADIQREAAFAAAETAAKPAARVPLTGPDTLILRGLASAHPRILTQEAISDATGNLPEVSVRTVQRRLGHLIERGLVCHPLGDRQGYTITEAGLRNLPVA